MERKIDSLIKELKIRKDLRNKNKTKSTRKNPSTADRKKIYSKTEGKCHICGGELGSMWHADHVLPHAFGGEDTVNNFLGSCATCNGARWYFSPQEIRLVLKIGRLALAEIRNGSRLGRKIAEKHLQEEEQREARRASNKSSK